MAAFAKRRCDACRGFPLSVPLISFRRLLRHPPMTTGSEPRTTHSPCLLWRGFPLGAALLILGDLFSKKEVLRAVPH